MDWRIWVKALEACGFKSVMTNPDLSLLEKRYDNCYVAIVQGKNL
jgi:hypothetical protein